MKQFFGAFFGSIIGIIVATVLAVVILVAVVKSSVNSALKSDEETTAAAKGNAVIKITLDGKINERTKENPFKELGDVGPFASTGEMGLNDMIDKLRSAAGDADVKGVYISVKNLEGGFASIEELRNAILAFRKSGKFVYTYGENFSHREYYLASASDKIFLNPQGMMDWRGLSMTLMFFKHTLEKLDVDMQIFRHGRYKSAIEPFMFDKMSTDNRLQSEVYVNSLWGHLVQGVASQRKLSEADLNMYANDLSVCMPESAKGKLVDELLYEDEVVALIKKKIGMKATDKMKFVDFEKYKGKEKSNLKAGRIAVIYANGSIGDGEGSDEEIGSDRLARTIREARLDEKIKAIVLRVNSPGGSALASDVIWREVQLAKTVKPTIVSMGDLAASGGYYISCAADRIFAQPNTLTGSIGVFGLIPNLQKMLQNKLGITLDTVNTNKYSDLGALRPLSARENAFIQSSVEKVYSVFTKRVADGRGMSVAAVDSIGQGRVWAGSDALRIGLVDELGGLQDAIAYAAKKAKLQEYRLQELPRQKSPFDGLLGKKESDLETQILKSKLGIYYDAFSGLQNLLDMKGVQARLPFEFILN